MMFEHPLIVAAVITLAAYSIAGAAIWKRAPRAGGKDA